MKTLMTVTLLGLGLVLATPAWAHAEGRRCSIQSIAGAWVFGTDVGQQKILPGGDITAIGTMNIDREGNVSGKFDVTVAEFGFFPNITYTGSVTVNPDCTGTLTFVTSLGTSRTDSIAVLGRTELWFMSQDPSNLWTGRARRISGPDDKSDDKDD
ncbi:MAG TPA: hypothetical protein VMO26_18065 [Vicinamibacterales bacterium]|nr:hypothetical protein [Vicinamibacterales bacterium]